jgi:hypothetical protein
MCSTRIGRVSLAEVRMIIIVQLPVTMQADLVDIRAK